MDLKFWSISLSSSSSSLILLHELVQNVWGWGGSVVAKETVVVQTCIHSQKHSKKEQHTAREVYYVGGTIFALAGSTALKSQSNRFVYIT